MTPARAMACGALLLSACVDRDPMTAQPRFDAYEENTFFPDARAMRPSAPGTVSQESHRARVLSRAVLPDDSDWVPEIPVPLTREILELGRHHFEITCATCHGVLGDGDSIVARKLAGRSPPSLIAPHTHDSGTAPTRTQTPANQNGVLPHRAGFYFTVITSSFGLMPSYADALNPRERWAVVAYLQALARSQAAPLASAPLEVQARLRGEPGADPSEPEGGVR